MTQKTNEYNGNSIDILEGLEAVRIRPGMYIGSTGSKGLHHLIYEIIDNGVDEHLAGFCSDITITINKNGSISIEDNGRGIPIDVHPKTGYTTERVIFTILHAGGKFGGSGYKISGGLHGVGASVVNALSAYLEVEVYKNGKIYKDRYENGGKPAVELSDEGELIPIGKTDKTGTKVTFYPDNTIFETIEWDSEIIKRRIKETTYLNKGLTIHFINKKIEEKETFHEERGIEGFIRDINSQYETITDVISFSGASNDIEVDIAMQYTKEFNEQIISYCNNIPTVEGGTHLTGMRSGLTRLINSYAKELGMIKEKDGTLDGKDVRCGLVAIISVKHKDPQYEGQTKGKLGSTDAKGAVEDVFTTEGQKFFDRNLEILKIIIENGIRSLRIRKKEEETRINVNNKEIKLQTNGKLASCISKNPDECEIVLVEGDSAGGTAKQGRDRKFQAILPLKGKIMNVEKQTLEKMLKYQEIRSMITAFGCGYGDEFDITKLKYDKIIILTDADVDGSHIRTLLLTFFFRYMKELIFSGKIYRGLPPLYKIEYETYKGKKKIKEFKYVYSDKELETVRKELGEKIVSIQRYKGLGEMSADQLWETTLSPETRRLAQITIEDIVESNYVTELLMGSKVEPRREFIIEEAKKR